MATTPDDAIDSLLGALGENLKSARIRAGRSQFELARQAGIGPIALSHLETGQGSSLRTFIRVLRSLNLQQGLDQLVPGNVIDPLSLIRVQTARRRVKHTRKPRKRPTDQSGKG
jgi:transcriptional regulator with XRE-family HTH domain